MTEEQTGAPLEETRDPRDWAAMRALGYRAPRRHGGRYYGAGTRPEGGRRDIDH